MTSQRRGARWPWVAGAVAVPHSCPSTSSSTSFYVLDLTAVYLILAIGLNLTLGYAGQISLAHAAFMALGSYAVAILGQRGFPFELGLLVGVALAFTMGLVLGFPALKVKHHYLAMVTLGFNIIVFLVLRNWESLTGGSFGISGIARPVWGPISFKSDRAYYLYILGWAGVVVASAYWILTSRWGRAFRAIRENELRAEVVGVSLRNYKLMAFAIGAAYAGVGGALFAPLLAYIDPGAYTIDRSIQFLMMVVMGGLGRFEGPFIGAAVVTILPEALRASEGLYLIIYALAVILMMLFMPKGLVRLWDLALSVLARHRRAPAPMAAPAARPEREGRGRHAAPRSPGLDEALLSPVGPQSGEPRRGARRAAGDHRPQRFGQDHAVQLRDWGAPPSSGQVLFGGEDITGITADAVYRRGLARTFQLIQIFPDIDSIENMLMAAQERTGTLLGRLLRREEIVETDRAMTFLEYLGIAALRDNLATNLSYGQQKLLDFGMALMPEPQLILLDEPLAGVNPTMIKHLVDHILDLNAGGHTFVVIEHNMEVVMSLCRRIIVLSQGERIAEGTPAEVSGNPLVLDAYFGR